MPTPLADNKHHNGSHSSPRFWAHCLRMRSMLFTLEVQSLWLPSSALFEH